MFSREFFQRPAFPLSQAPWKRWRKRFRKSWQLVALSGWPSIFIPQYILLTVNCTMYILYQAKSLTWSDDITWQCQCMALQWKDTDIIQPIDLIIILWNEDDNILQQVPNRFPPSGLPGDRPPLTQPFIIIIIIITSDQSSHHHRISNILIAISIVRDNNHQLT